MKVCGVQLNWTDLSDGSSYWFKGPWRPDRMLLLSPRYVCDGGVAQVACRYKSGLRLTVPDDVIATPSVHSALLATLCLNALVQPLVLRCPHLPRRSAQLLQHRVVAATVRRVPSCGLAAGDTFLRRPLSERHGSRGYAELAALALEPQRRLRALHFQAELMHNPGMDTSSEHPSGNSQLP